MQINVANIGNRIAFHRSRLNMSTGALAVQIGKSLATISRIENGKQAVSLHLLKAIAEALRVHVFSLLTDDALLHSELLPPWEHDEPAPGLFAMTLLACRKLNGYESAAVAAELGIGADELGSIELGVALPDKKLVARFALLYRVPEAELLELRRLERDAPHLSRRLSQFQRFVLALLRDLRDAGKNNAANRLVHVARELLSRGLPEENVEMPPGLCERRHLYYKIGHLSDTLLLALQDMDFCREAEARAAAWTQRRPEADSAPDTPPEGSPEAEVMRALDNLIADVPPPSSSSSAAAPRTASPKIHPALDATLGPATCPRLGSVPPPEDDVTRFISPEDPIDEAGPADDAQENR